jgi:ankyrin repeat protein
MPSDGELNALPKLHAAAFSGHGDELIRLLDAGADPNSLDGHGASALAWAVRGARHRCAEVMLKGGADPNLVMSGEIAPLHAAVLYNDEKMCSLLLEFGTDRFLVDVGGRTAYQLAMSKGRAEVAHACAVPHEMLLQAVSERSPKQLKLCLDNGARVNGGAWTALHDAVQRRATELCRILLERGASPSKLEPDSRRSALHVAAATGDVEIAALLCDYLQPRELETRSAGGRTALHLAAEENHHAVLTVIANRIASGGAGKAGSGSSAMTATAATAAGSSSSSSLSSPMMGSARAEAGDTTVGTLPAGVVDPRDDLDHTPLHIACHRGHLATVQALIALGADPMARTATGATPLHLSSSGGHAEVTGYLVTNTNASPSATDRQGRTPLAVTPANAHPTLLALLPPTDTLSHRILTAGPGDVAACVVDGGDVNRVSAQGLYPLHQAVMRGDESIVEVVLGKGADVMVYDAARGETPLHLACSGTNTGNTGGWGAMSSSAAAASSSGGGGRGGGGDDEHAAGGGAAEAADGNAASLSIVKMLLGRGAKPNEPSEATGRTPLHCAVAAGRIDIVEVLVARGARLHHVDAGGMNVLHMAAEGAHREMIGFLLGGPTREFDINARTLGEGLTPLHIASSAGCALSCQMLIEMGAERDAVTGPADGSGIAPLPVAASSRPQTAPASASLAQGQGLPVAPSTPRPTKMRPGSSRLGGSGLGGGARAGGRSSAFAASAAAASPSATMSSSTSSSSMINSNNNNNNSNSNSNNHDTTSTSSLPAVATQGSSHVPVTGLPAGSTALHLACAKDHDAVVAFLLAAGCRVDIVNGGGDTPVLTSARHGPRLDISGGGKSSLSRSPSSGTLSHLRGRKGGRAAPSGATTATVCLPLLLRAGASVHDRDAFLSTPLHLAADRGCIPDTVLLLSSGADKTAEDREALDPATRATVHGFARLAMMIQGRMTEGEARDAERGDKAMLASTGVGQDVRAAVLRGDFATLKKIVSDSKARGVPFGQALGKESTAIHLAASKGEERCLALLLEEGAPLDALDADGRTAAHSALSATDTACLTTFLNYGGSLSIADSKGRTPLHYAVNLKRHGGGGDTAAGAGDGDNNGDGEASIDKALTFVTTMLDYGADPELRDARGYNALHAAIAGMAARDIVALLLERFPSLIETRVGGTGQTALHIAVESGRADLMQVLTAVRSTSVSR